MIREKAMELVAALRSGKYKQGREMLQQQTALGEKSYCCLGVACAVAGFEPTGKNRIGAALFKDDEDGFTYETELPPTVMKHFGFRSALGFAGIGAPVLTGLDGEVYTSLAYANDSGVPFSVLADYIEANWEHL